LQGAEVQQSEADVDLIAGARDDGRIAGARTELADDVVSEAVERTVEVRQIGAGVAGDDAAAQVGRAGVADAAGEVGLAAGVASDGGVGDGGVGDVGGAALDDDRAAVIRGGVAADGAVDDV